MRLHTRLIFLCVGLSLANVASLPMVRAVPVPERPPRPQQPIELTGTEWVGEDGQWVTTYRFEPKGVLWYSYRTGTFRNGTWKVHGDTLQIQINDGYYEFRGSIHDGTIVGESWNVRGDRWQHLLRKRR
jgi:hypothetical protein